MLERRRAEDSPRMSTGYTVFRALVATVWMMRRIKRSGAADTSLNVLRYSCMFRMS